MAKQAKTWTLKKYFKLQSQYFSEKSQFDCTGHTLCLLLCETGEDIEKCVYLVFFYIIVQHPVFLFHYIQFIMQIHNLDNIMKRRWYSEKLHCTYPIHHGPMNPLCDYIIHVWRNIIMLCIYALQVCYHALHFRVFWSHTTALCEEQTQKTE